MGSGLVLPHIHTLRLQETYCPAVALKGWVAMSLRELDLAYTNLEPEAWEVLRERIASFSSSPHVVRRACWSGAHDPLCPVLSRWPTLTRAPTLIWPCLTSPGQRTLSMGTWQKTSWFTRALQDDALS